MPNVLFTSLLAQVYTLTNRPDYVNETTLAIQTATLRAHQREFYFKDLVESGIQFQSADYKLKLNPFSLYSNYRSLKYLRKFDYTSNCPGILLCKKELTDIKDTYGRDLVDIYYAAGAEVNMKLSTQEQYMLFGLYVHPIVLPDTYNSWIANEYPQAIVNEAASFIQGGLLGMTAQATYNHQIALDTYMNIDMANITSVGY